MAPRMPKARCEFGDFQTPDSLASKAVCTVHKAGFRPSSIVEPTCGKGAFVIAAAHSFPDAQIIGGEINSEYVAHLERRLGDATGRRQNIKIIHCNFFDTDWRNDLRSLPDPLLVIGNFPWVTNAALGAIQSSNLPKKANFQGYNGLEALMGKSNFDISEWMLLRNLAWLEGRSGAIAMLCKTAVARKVLVHAWKNCIPIRQASLYQIDAMKYFGAAVDACLFFLRVDPDGRSSDCQVFDSLDHTEPSHTIGYHDGIMIADVELYSKWRCICGSDPHYVWRSGIKHDCSRVMELTRNGSGYINGDGISVYIEDTYVYPMLKSSDIGGKCRHRDQKYMLVTQKHIGDPTSGIASMAPRTWQYLTVNEQALAMRSSSIYKGKPDFAIFGVGAYSFSDWKVAISGFYKSLDFKVIGPINGKPVVFDDTVYFLACASEAEANLLHRLLNNDATKALIGSMIFWSNKRPITIDLLKRVDLRKVAELLGLRAEYEKHTKKFQKQGNTRRTAPR